MTARPELPAREVECPLQDSPFDVRTGAVWVES